MFDQQSIVICWALEICRKRIFLSHLGVRPDTKLKNDQHTKVPIWYRENLNASIAELAKEGVTRQIGSTSHEKPTSGTTFFNALIEVRKNN